MSVIICWKPVNNRRKSVVGGSSFVEVLEKAFKPLPIVLNDECVPILRGISACGFSGADELIAAIIENGKIDVTAEH